MSRRLGLGAFAAGLLAAVLSALVRATTPLSEFDVPNADLLLSKGLSAAAVALVAYGVYRFLTAFLVARIADRRRAHDVRNVLRLTLGVLGLVGVLGAFTDQWLGVLVSFGVIGFAVTFTTLWETGGPLASNQPTGRTVTVPNSLVLSSEVVNYGALFDRVWTEVPVQVSYETDLPFVRQLLLDVADEELGDDTDAAMRRYRARLAESPLDLDVADGPTVNVAQEESWVVFRLRVLVPPTRAQRVKNRLYERVLDRLGDHPDRVSFPVSRNR